ncbi:hypothetical protein [Cryptosporangium minutisporangium]|uniref:hypothetical protein n=1 Tax=Cryptosporangium minutisporangium TaxID=113569 RepID=UPI0031EE80D6
MAAPASAVLPAVRADEGLDVAWDAAGLRQLLEGWSHPMLDRRSFLTIAGAALTQPAWHALDHPVPSLAAGRSSEARVEGRLLDLIEDIVAHAQRLDDQQGGGAADFVEAQFTHVAQLLRRASYDSRSGRRLAAAAAQLAQTAGFMAYDAGRDGAAQRWYLTGLRAAHAAGDPGLSASILGLMSNQAVTLGLRADATQLGSAAAESASHAPPIVQALLASRGSLAYAASGDLTGYRHALDRISSALGRAETAGEPAPRWAAYVSATELDAITGRGMVLLASQMPTRAPHLLAEAEQLLTARAHTDPDEVPQRSALRHSAWLALVHAQTGDLDQAVAAGRACLPRLRTVNSVRSARLLGRLRRELAPHASRSTAVRRLLSDLDAPLSPSATADSGSTRISG